MANKNTTGTMYVRYKKREERIIRQIDKRTANGDDREYDRVWNNHNTTDKGDRVWTF